MKDIDMDEEKFQSIHYCHDSGCLTIIDQRKLPLQLVTVELHELDQIWQAIKTLQIRGAPAIGIAAAWGIAMHLRQSPGDAEALKIALNHAGGYLATARPTAVNLFWAIERMKKRFSALCEQGSAPSQIIAGMLAEAQAIQSEDELMCAAISEHALELLSPDMRILTHCNAGALATARYGTALGPIYLGQSKGYNFSVFVDETRPLLQGARLTAWELLQAGVTTTLICDNMAARVLSKLGIGAVLVGADRVAVNGDTANKIGTQGLAVLASYYKVPFYVLCPSSTIDSRLLSGESIEIEEREASEVTSLAGVSIAPCDVAVYNPAFDVTPGYLITAIITEKGVFKPPFNFA